MADRQKVLYVPDMAYVFISIIPARKNGCHAIVDTDGNNPKSSRLEILRQRTNDVKMVGKEVNGLYHAVIRIYKDSTNLVSESKIRFWHERLGQCADQMLKNLITKVIGIDKNEIN